jgi:hypothetical protein
VAPGYGDCQFVSQFVFTLVAALRRSGLEIGHVKCADPPRMAHGLTRVTHFSAIPKEQRQRLAEESVDVYLGNVEVIQRLADNYGFPVHFVWQPNLITTRKSLTDAEKNYHDSIPVEQREFRNDVTLSLRSRTADVQNLVDLSDALDGATGTVFADECHLTPDGNERIARELLQRFPLTVPVGDAGARLRNDNYTSPSTTTPPPHLNAP